MLLQLASPFINYVLPLDLISAAVVFGAVVLGVATARIVVAPRAIVAAAALAILYVALPFDLMATSFLDTRIVIMLGFLLFAAVDPARLPRPSAVSPVSACRAVRGSHGRGGGGLDGTSARPRRSPGGHRRRSAGGLGLHDQRAAR